MGIGPYSSPMRLRWQLTLSILAILVFSGLLPHSPCICSLVLYEICLYMDSLKQSLNFLPLSILSMWLVHLIFCNLPPFTLISPLITLNFIFVQFRATIKLALHITFQYRAKYAAAPIFQKTSAFSYVLLVLSKLHIHILYYFLFHRFLNFKRHIYEEYKSKAYIFLSLNDSSIIIL